MNLVGGGFLFFVITAVTVCGEFVSNSDQSQDLPRYVVFPGLDAEAEEIEEWNIGFASPFNVFFGPKPYILGWLSEAPFGPAPEEEEIEVGEGDYEIEEGEEGEEGEIEGEGEGEGEGDYEEAGYPDYEKA